MLHSTKWVFQHTPWVKLHSDTLCGEMKISALQANLKCKFKPMPIEQIAQYLSVTAPALVGATATAPWICDCTRIVISWAVSIFLPLPSFYWTLLVLFCLKLFDILCRNLITGWTHFSHFATKFLFCAPHNYFREENRVNCSLSKSPQKHGLQQKYLQLNPKFFIQELSHKEKVQKNS